MSTTEVLVGVQRGRRPSPASLARYARVAVDRRSYRHLLYLVLALPQGILYVAVLGAGLSAGAGLPGTPVGLFVLRGPLFAVRALAAVERPLARRLLHVAIHPPI